MRADGSDDEAGQLLFMPAAAPLSVRGARGDIFATWRIAYEAARATDNLEAARAHYAAAARAEAVIALLPPAAASALAALRVAVRLMDDEGDEPSYAALLRAALHQLERAPELTARPPGTPPG